MPETNEENIMKPYGYIYITTNLINGMRYVGQKKMNRNWKNYLGSGTWFLKAVKKYGEENFSKIILDFANTPEELNEKEVSYIAFYNAVESDDFYNLSYGGHESPTEETKEKIRQSHIGLLAGEKHPMYGKHHTKEAREKQSVSKKGKPSWNKGIPSSDEAKEKLKQSRQRIPVRGHKPVRCVETGDIYNSVTDAERAIGCGSGSIGRVCRGLRKTLNGLHWEFI